MDWATLIICLMIKKHSSCFPTKSLRKKYATDDFKFLTTFKYQPSNRFDITNYSEDIKDCFS